MCKNPSSAETIIANATHRLDFSRRESAAQVVAWFPRRKAARRQLAAAERDLMRSALRAYTASRVVTRCEGEFDTGYLYRCVGSVQRNPHPCSEIGMVE